MVEIGVQKFADLTSDLELQDQAGQIWHGVMSVVQLSIQNNKIFNRWFRGNGNI